MKFFITVYKLVKMTKGSEMQVYDMIKPEMKEHINTTRIVLTQSIIIINVRNKLVRQKWLHRKII